jgi:hypothetical protein
VDPSSAQIGVPAAGPDSTPAASDPTPTLSQVVLNPGARVRARLADGREVRGRVIAAFTSDSQHLSVCAEPATQCSSSGDSSVVVLSPESMRSLSVRGKASGGGFYLGVYGGGLAGALSGGSLREPSFPGMALGMVVGAITGTVLGSRMTAWIPVFPCYHGCAAGSYPEE